MEHKFVGNSAGKCTFELFGRTCARGVLAHTFLAECEACHKKGAIDIYEDNPDIAICWPCRELVIKTSTISRNPEIENKLDEAEAKLAEKLRDASLAGMRFSGDLFNIKTQTYQELALEIKRDDNIALKDKDIVFQKIVSDRIRHLSRILFDMQEDIRSLGIEKMAAIESLRAFGGTIRDEIRQKIKESDATYQPIINQEAIKKSLKSRAVKTPFERAVEVLALNSNISIEAARDIMMKGWKESNK